MGGKPTVYGRLAVVVGFAALVATQWAGPNSVAAADGIAYITSGVNLIRTGEYVNAFGEKELWFPPLYPLLIGALSAGGRLDAVLVSRLISFAAALITLLLMWPALRAGGRHRLVVLASASVLALNPLFQEMAHASLTEMSGTALAFAAVAVWLGASPGSSPWRYAWFGVLVAAGYLVRPEVIMLLPVLAAFDLWRYGLRACRTGYMAAALACAAVTAPYVIWLSVQTGSPTLSNKSEVNLAVSRSAYWRTPRETIDPVSLELQFSRHPVTLRSEIGRYADNWRRVGRAFGRIFWLPLGGGILVCAAIGLWALRTEGRLLWGLAAQCLFVFVLAVYAVQDRYLHAVLPVVCVLAGSGIAFLADRLRYGPRLAGFVTAGLLLWTAVGLLEGGTRHIHETIRDGVPRGSILKDAGVWLRGQAPDGGVVYEYGATVGYYAGRTRRRLTSSDLDTILRYIERHEQRQPAVWVALSSLEAPAYHASVRNLLKEGHSALEPIAEFKDARGRVVILRVRTPVEAPRQTSPPTQSVAPPAPERWTQPAARLSRVEPPRAREPLADGI